jgi:hypothetical protein
MVGGRRQGTEIALALPHDTVAFCRLAAAAEGAPDIGSLSAEADGNCLIKAANNIN